MKRILLILILLILTGHSFSQMKSPISGINIAGFNNAYTKVPAPSIYLNRNLTNTTPTSQIVAIYDAAVPANAKTAIDEAAKIWSYIINTGYPNNTSQPAIKIQVKWQDLSDSINAVTYFDSTNKIINFYQNFSGAVKQNVYYPVALANKLSQSDLNGSKPEMFIIFNKKRQWYYGLDGNTPANYFDLVTIAMHEIVHGLGFTGSFQVSVGGIGSWGVDSTKKYPSIYDCYVADIAKASVVNNTSTYPNPSSSLGIFLKNNNVLFNGSNAMNSAGLSTPPRLYSPNSWSPGSSISHLDENTYQVGSSNSLMTPITSPAESIHSPGEIVVSALMDLGWDINRLFTVTSPKVNICALCR